MFQKYLRSVIQSKCPVNPSHLGPAMKQYDPLIKTDAWLLRDGPVHQTRRMQLYFGVRGETELEMRHRQ